MNVIFFTQGSRLELFYRVMLAMKGFVKFDKVGFYAVESRFFERFKKDQPEINSGAFSLLKEWDIVREARGIKPNLEIIKKYEEELGDPFLWNALIADRNIFSGKKCAYTQDYKPRFNHEEMLSILQVGLQKIENLFHEVQPDFIVSFQCITLGEYLSFLYAKAHNIPILNLRPTRIKNYIYAGEDVLEPSKNLQKTYELLLKEGMVPTLEKEIITYLEKFRSTNAMYEGVIPPSNKTPGSNVLNRKKIPVFRIIKSLLNAIRNDFIFKVGNFKYDNSIISSIGYLYYQKFKRPIIARKMKAVFKNTYVTKATLKDISFTYFPLHTEPEVTLNVYGKPYLNQIETLRLISHNLPISMKLVVKEHPCSIGKRPISYYKKLLAIPNIMIAPPEMKSRLLVINADLVTVISGSGGLEGLMLQVPVIVLGNAPFNFLPENMIHYVKSPQSLGVEICNLMKNYVYDEKAMICYIGAVIQNSVDVDFYSVLSGRKEAYREGAQLDQANFKIEYETQVNRLAKYLIDTYYRYIS